MPDFCSNFPKKDRMKFFGIIFITCSLILSSCADSPTLKGRSKRAGTPVAGEVGQLLVVCENDVWQSGLDTLVEYSMMQFISPYFPDVPTFRTIQKSPKHFEEGVKTYRSILFITLDENYKKTRATAQAKKDKWAIDQTIIEITGKDISQVKTFCLEGGLNAVHDDFAYMDWKRLMNTNLENESAGLNQELAENFGITLAVPNGSRIINKRKNFFRIDFPNSSRPIEFTNAGSQDRGTVLSGVMIYQYDYVNSAQMNVEKLLKSRDTMLKYNAPYQVDGMYMGTQYTELVYPKHNAMKNDYGTISGIEIRGMYTFVGLPIRAPGGCFWEFHFVHPKRKKVVCISGYLDAPSTTSWILYLRTIQAVLKSVQFAK